MGLELDGEESYFHVGEGLLLSELEQGLIKVALEMDVHQHGEELVQLPMALGVGLDLALHLQE